MGHKRISFLHWLSILSRWWPVLLIAPYMGFAFLNTKVAVAGTTDIKLSKGKTKMVNHYQMGSSANRFLGGLKIRCQFGANIVFSLNNRLINNKDSTCQN